MRREVTVFSALFLLAVPGDGCDQRSEESIKVVAVNLTRLHLGETNTPLPSQILLLPVRSGRALPESVMSRFPEMSSAGGPFAAGDSVFDDPDRRLIFGGISDQFCLVHYEYGGWTYGHMTVLFALTGNQSKPLWAHAGGEYDSLEEFVKENDPDAVTNEVNNAAF